MKIEVLGTSFNIQAYDNQEEINVTVVTGKVNVTHKNKSEHIELIANACRLKFIDGTSKKQIDEELDFLKKSE